LPHLSTDITIAIQAIAWQLIAIVESSLRAVEMLEVHKRYILDENQQPIAVQISIDKFEQIEKILAESGEAIFLSGSLEGLSNGDSSEEECELVYVNGILVVKAQGTLDIDVVEFIKEQREERSKKLGGW
jgi:hypothetical protein